MCLALPGKILEAQEIGGISIGLIQFGEATRHVYLDGVPDARPGDYVLVHAGLAVSRIDQAEAERTLELMQRVL